MQRMSHRHNYFNVILVLSISGDIRAFALYSMVDGSGKKNKIKTRLPNSVGGKNSSIAACRRKKKKKQKYKALSDSLYLGL